MLEKLCNQIIDELNNYKPTKYPRGFNSVEEWKKEIENGVLLFKKLINELKYEQIESINEYSNSYIDSMRWLTLYGISLNEKGE